MITLNSLKIMQSNPKKIKPNKPREINKKQAMNRLKPLVDRLERIKGVFSRGRKLTIARLMKLEKISRSTASNDLQILADEGFISFILSDIDCDYGRTSTKLYSIA